MPISWLDWARAVPPAAARPHGRLLAGPLTVLLERSQRVLDIVTGGRQPSGSACRRTR
jgi:hypothetical protein